MSYSDYYDFKPVEMEYAVSITTKYYIINFLLCYTVLEHLVTVPSSDTMDCMVLGVVWAELMSTSKFTALPYFPHQRALAIKVYVTDMPFVCWGEQYCDI